MKFEWNEKKDGDFIESKDINSIANHIIENEGAEIVNIGNVNRSWNKLLVYDKYGNPTKKKNDVHAGVFKFNIEDSDGDVEQIIKCILIQTINSVTDKSYPENDFFDVHQLVIYGYGRQIFRTIENLNDSTYPAFEDYKVTPYNDELDEFAPNDQPLSAEKGYALKQEIDNTKERLLEKESIYNKITDIEEYADNRMYPTAKAVKKYVDANKTEVNVLKGQASGYGVVLTDISPIEHEIIAREDIGATAIIRCGKNLLPLERELTFPNDNNHTINCYIPTPFTLSLRLAIDAVTSPKAAFLKFVYDDGTEEPITFNSWSIASGSGTYKKNKTINNGKVLKQIVFLNWTAMTGRVYEVQVELGSNATAYEPYVEPIEYPSDQEPLKIPSLYPTTVLYEAGGYGLVTAEYNRDINKVIANLENAILSLGGNV